MTHTCHACGCDREAHPEVPFCKECFNILPKKHKQILWKERVEGQCGGCDPEGFSADWLNLYNLGVAVILTVQYFECEAPKLMYDEDGFCWGCGVDKAKKTYKIANKIVEKYGLDRRRRT